MNTFLASISLRVQEGNIVTVLFFKFLIWRYCTWGKKSDSGMLNPLTIWVKDMKILSLSYMFILQLQLNTIRDSDLLGWQLLLADIFQYWPQKSIGGESLINLFIWSKLCQI